MTEANGLPCPVCNQGILVVRNEPHRVRVGVEKFVLSDAVHFLECSICGERIFLGAESFKADNSAAKNLLREVLTGAQKLTGEDVSFLRAILQLSARELSLRLELDPSTVSQWETRKSTLSYPVAFAVAVFCFREIMKGDVRFADEISVLIASAFKKTDR